MSRVFACVLCSWTVLALATRAFPRDPNFSELDQNENGLVEIQEIGPNDHAVLLQYAHFAGVGFSQAISISDLRRGRAEYFAQLRIKSFAVPQRDGRFGRPANGKSRLRGFGRKSVAAASVPESVHEKILSVYSQCDVNRDHKLDQDELSTSKEFETTWRYADRDDSWTLTPEEVLFYLDVKERQRRHHQMLDRSTVTIGGVEVTSEHRQAAAEFFRAHDQNSNGLIEGPEIDPAWNDGSFMTYHDANRDARITLREMILGIAEQEIDRNRQLAVESNDTLAERVDRIQMRELTELVFDRYKKDDPNVLRKLRGGWKKLGDDVLTSDANRNDVITKEEFSRWLMESLSIQPQSDQLGSRTPIWFLRCDQDSDGQITMAEYLAGHTADQASQFRVFDSNEDGIVTAAEATSREAGGKLRFRAEGVRTIESGNVAESELYVVEDVVIADLDVQLTIAKFGAENLQVDLVGPDGSSAALYISPRKKPWANDRIFEEALIDDEAPQIKQPLARRPANRTFRPQGLDSPKLNGLAVFDRKSTRGVWKLVVQSNGGPAILHGWSLFVEPASSSSVRSKRRGGK